MKYFAYLLITPLVWWLATRIVWFLTNWPGSKREDVLFSASLFVLAFWGIIILVGL